MDSCPRFRIFLLDKRVAGLTSDYRIKLVLDAAAISHTHTTLQQVAEVGGPSCQWILRSQP